jgi:H+/Cl- antiporter ClcA
MSSPADQQPPIEPRTYLRLVLLGALIGIPAALVAAGFIALVHHSEHWLWTDLPDALGESSPPWYLVIALPIVGAALVVAARRFLPGDGGHSPLLGIGGGVTPVSSATGVALAALATLAFGAVLGPEAPLIALGSVVGVAFTYFVRVGEREKAVAATAGSFSAISALFGGPLVAGVLLVEAGIGFGAGLIPILLPGFVAAAIGYTIFIGFGNNGGIGTQAITVPHLPPYNGTHVYDLAIAVVVGVAVAIVVSLIRRVGASVADDGGRRLGMPLLLIAGGAAVGVIAELAGVLGANSQDVLFSGQSSIPVLVTESSTKILLVLIVAKGLAYAVSLGCGFRGGPVFPAIFVGVAMASLSDVWFNVSPTLALAVGAAAGMAAVTRLLFTPALFAGLLVGTAGVDAVPAAVLAAAASWMTAMAIQRRAAPESVAQSEAGAPARA